MAMPDKCSVWIGFDPRETTAFCVARESAKFAFGPTQHPVRGIVLSQMRDRGLYWRPTVTKDGQMWDVISDAPMSTEFSISRFLTPHLAGSGWALFMDCDMMVRGRLRELFKLADPSKAVMCVQHEHVPDNRVKMDNQIQTRYPRKNWSSVVLYNCDHPANSRLTLEMINSVPGRDLHRFCWLNDKDIGALPHEWNYLVGHTNLPRGSQPKIVHWTDGIPSMPGYEDAEYSSEYFGWLRRWAA